MQQGGLFVLGVVRTGGLTVCLQIAERGGTVVDYRRVSSPPIKDRWMSGAAVRIQWVYPRLREIVIMYLLVRSAPADTVEHDGRVPHAHFEGDFPRCFSRRGWWVRCGELAWAAGHDSVQIGKRKGAGLHGWLQSMKHDGAARGPSQALHSHFIVSRLVRSDMEMTISGDW